MKYYKDQETQEVYAFVDDGSQDFLIRPSMLEMSPEEIQEHLNPASPSMSREDVMQARLIAYSDPVTGSDRHFAESSAELASGNIDGATRSKLAGIARRDEIRNTHQWPASKTKA